jgi:hypothetical protein
MAQGSRHTQQRDMVNGLGAGFRRPAEKQEPITECNSGSYPAGGLQKWLEDNFQSSLLGELHGVVSI